MIRDVILDFIELRGTRDTSWSFTPLVHARSLGAKYGLDRLYIKPLNPTNSFKARGQSAAITRAKYLGVETVSVPSAGNAGNAMAAYAARAGLHGKVFLPKDVKEPFVRECRLYGADIQLVDGLIRTRDGSRPSRAARSSGMTSRRSRSLIASRARRPWRTSSPSRWTGAGPTGSSIRQVEAPA